MQQVLEFYQKNILCKEFIYLRLELEKIKSTTVTYAIAFEISNFVDHLA
jgi:hypothetical protein